MMDTPRNKKQRRRRTRRSNAPYPSMFLPDELIIEILSLLCVKNILQLKCVSKSWNAIISDPTFVEKHLKKSSQNPHLTLLWDQQKEGFNIASYPMHRLLKNASITVYGLNFHRLKKNCIVAGSCNGLLCLVFHSQTVTPTYLHHRYRLRFLNPATRTRSKELGLLCYSTPVYAYFSYYSMFTFGYDASTRTYKVVVVLAEKKEGLWISEVKVFSLGNNCWRNIQSVPLNWFNAHSRHRRLNDGVHFSGTINWMTYKSINHDGNFLVSSLDLSTETYKQFLLPSDFNGVPYYQQPVLRVLMDSLCFSHDSNLTELVLWQMKEYGVEESWTQLFKIRYQNLQMHNIFYGYQLACIYVNGDMVIFANEYGKRAFIYNLKDKTAEKIKARNFIQWFRGAKDYVESLVLVH